MVTISCDECGVIGECSSVVMPDAKIMNDHMDKSHNGESFGYSVWKD